MVKRECCQKCGKQCEFLKQREHFAGMVLDEKKSQMNRIEAQSNGTADCYEFIYCNDCWHGMGELLQGKGYLPAGMFPFAPDENR